MYKCSIQSIYYFLPDSSKAANRYCFRMAEKETNPPATAAEFYSKGNEAFVNEDYNTAIELYSAALGLDPVLADSMVARAHALIKTDKYEDAKKDADKAIDILRAGGGATPLLSKAFLRSGVASFHLGRYRDARNCFVEGQKVGEESGLKQWLCWSDEKIQKFGDFAPGVKNTEDKSNKTDDAKATSETVPVAAAPTPAVVDNDVMPVPKVIIPNIINIQITNSSKYYIDIS